MEIKKAIIIAEDVGRCFFSTSKTKTQEEKPVIHYIVEEAAKSGIESIIVVTSNSKEAEDKILENEKNKLVKNTRSINESANIHFVYKQNMTGLGEAILYTEEFIDDDPFAVLLVDDIITSKTPAIQQLLEAFDDFDKQIIAVKEVPEMDVDKYEIIDSAAKCEDIYLVTDLIENPSPRLTPSNIAVMGRYILKPSIFPILKKTHKAEASDYLLTEALTEISRMEGLLPLELEENGMTLEYH